MFMRISLFIFLFVIEISNIKSQIIVLAVPKNNYIYTCIDTQIEIAVSGIDSKDIKVTSEDGVTIKQIENEKYNIKATKPGDIIINIEAKGQLLTKKLNVRTIPDPKPPLIGKHGRIAKNEILELDSLSCVLNFEYKAKCNITSYVVVIKRKNSRVDAASFNIKGKQLSSDVKSYFKTLQIGDSIMFLDIKAACPCDSKERLIGGMSVIIE